MLLPTHIAVILYRSLEQLISPICRPLPHAILERTPLRLRHRLEVRRNRKVLLLSLIHI